jgi:hypothetical protein
MDALDKEIPDPEEFLLALLYEGFPRMNSCMNAEKGFHSMTHTQSLEKLDMARRDAGDDFRRRFRRRDSIACQRGAAAVVEKCLAVISVKTDIGEKHIFMIAFEKYGLRPFRASPTQQVLDDALRVGASIDIIAEKNHAVRRLYG